MGPDCEYFLAKEIKDGLAKGKNPSEIGRELSPKIQKKFGVSISVQNIRSRARSVLHPRGRPKPPKIGPTGYAYCPTCKANYREVVCPGCAPDAVKPTAIIPAPVEPSGELTANERVKFKALEGVIKQEMESFVAVGNALLTIRDAKLYREKYRNFPEYCVAKWGFGRAYANRLITGSQVATNLAPRGADFDTLVKPINEKQVRPLAILEPDQQCEVWEEAVRSADGKIVTFKQVKALVEARTGIPVKKTRQRDPHPESDAMHFAMVARTQLDRIRDDDPRREQALNEVITWCSAKLQEPMVKKSS